MNYVTDGHHFYHHGFTGIPMGLPLAPEISRMCTAFILKDYHPPPGEVLTLFFDDVASTYRIPMDLLAPYKLELGPDNRTQDVLYDSSTESFLTVTQEHRQPAPLHISSIHPSRKMVLNSYRGAVDRSLAIATYPDIALTQFFQRCMPALVRAGHQPSDIVADISDVFYFPAHTAKNPIPDTTAIEFHFSNDRPTMKQLLPLEKAPFHLRPKIPLAPMRSMITYSFPEHSLDHNYFICGQRCSFVRPITSFSKLR